MGSLPTTLRTFFLLGPPNVLRVAHYRMALRAGLHPVQKVQARLATGPYFGAPDTPGNAPRASTRSGHSIRLFGWFEFPFDESRMPDWHLNPFTGQRVEAVSRPWWIIPDFDPAVGDIKGVWELSRFDWAVRFAKRAATGDAQSLERLNVWLGDWCEHNPAFLGPNWKCGQEASIRVMHLATAALLLEQHEHPTRALLELVRAHLRRIAPTIGYAVAQDNNHGTSEAAALFIGGSWLARQGDREGMGWESEGRRWLENRLARLFEPDGSFSQYSVNYHRVALDTLSIAEIWRHRLRLPPFSERWRARAAAAAEWLRAMVDPRTGDAPNIGANDGARLIPVTDTEYRDFRPSVQLASALFSNVRAYDFDPADEVLDWFRIERPEAPAPPRVSRVFDDGGYGVLHSGQAMAVLRYPRFRFRPSHADALHLDLWVDGENHLRDAGTWSYNGDAVSLRYFPGTESHNTVQFDARDQMPRLGRFLFGDWLETEAVEPLRNEGGAECFGASYRDRLGARHRRSVRLAADHLEVADDVSGFQRSAVLRWRLRPDDDWRLDGTSVRSGSGRLTVTSTSPIARCEIVKGQESRYYLQRSELPVLEVEIHRPGTLTTTYTWERM